MHVDDHHVEAANRADDLARAPPIRRLLHRVLAAEKPPDPEPDGRMGVDNQAAAVGTGHAGNLTLGSICRPAKNANRPEAGAGQS
jgi:hypothetical protein